jgi:WD40 repeat protein/serine/threonine protein kinase
MKFNLTTWLQRFTARDGAGEASPREAAAESGWRPGDVIAGLYEVTRLLGEGGMGRVWLVRHLGWHCALAVKEPHPEVVGDRTARRAFAREAQNWVQLPLHPNVVTAYYVRELDGVLRIFAEFVDGEGLDVRLRRGPLPLPKALPIAIQCCDGLAHAHDAGLIHRDVKPNNVLLTRAGTAKLVDFGLAKAMDERREYPSPTVHSFGAQTAEFTARGGTPMYMSPEQRRREKGRAARVGPTTDIWSFGVMLCEMLTGARPEHADGARRLIAQQGALPVALRATILQCVDKSPTRRWQNFVVLGDHLRALYPQLCGEVYPHGRIKGITPGPDELNNRALSLLDLDKPVEAQRCWQQALARDPHHSQSLFNRSLLAWKAGEIADSQLVQGLEAVSAGHYPADWCSPYYLGLVHLMRGDQAAARAALREAARRAPDEPDVLQALEQARQPGRRWGRELSTLDSQRGPVIAVALSADGQVALVAGADRALRLWQTANSQRRAQWDGAHQYGITAATLSADGRWVLSVGLDNALCLWDTVEGFRQTLAEDVAGMRGVALSGDGRWALTGDRLGNLWRWDCLDASCGNLTTRWIDDVRGLALDASGEWGVTGGIDEIFRVWKVAAGREWVQRKGHVGPIRAVAISADGQWALSGGQDKTIRYWSVFGGRCLRVLSGHTAPVTALALSADGRWAVSGGEDRTVRLWHTASGRCLRTFSGHTGSVSGVGISADGRLLLSGSEDGTLKLWAAPAAGDEDDLSLAVSRIQASENRLAMQADVARAMAEAWEDLRQADYPAAHRHLLRARELPGFARSPELLAAWAELRRHAHAIGIRGMYPRHRLDGHRGAIKALAVSAHAALALSGDDEGLLRCWAPDSGACRAQTIDPGGEISTVYLSHDGSWAASGCVNGRFMRWTLESGTGERYFPDDSRNLSQFVVTPDERWLLFPGPYGLECWDLARRQLHWTTGEDSGQITALVVPADNRRVLTGSDDGSVRQWALDSGCCTRILSGRGGRIHVMAVSPCRRWLLVSERTPALHLWDWRAGTYVQALTGHTDLVTALAISPDGRWALSGSADATVRVWQLETGVCRHLLTEHDAPITAVAWSADGRWCLTADRDGELRCWEVDWELHAFPAADWDETARPYLKHYLSIHKDGGDEAAFAQLLETIGNAGYGWLRPDGIRKTLDAMRTQAR